MVSAQQRHTVGTYSTRQEAEQAFKQLYCEGFPMTRMFLVNRDRELLEELNQAIRKTSLREKVQTEQPPCAMITGSILGAIGGCLASIGIVLMPGVAPVLAVVGGSVGTALGSTLAGAGIGLLSGGVISVCSCSRATSEQFRDESDRLFPEEYLVVVIGTGEEVCRAKAILKKTGV